MLGSDPWTQLRLVSHSKCDTRPSIEHSNVRPYLLEPFHPLLGYARSFYVESLQGWDWDELHQPLICQFRILQYKPFDARERLQQRGIFIRELPGSHRRSFEELNLDGLGGVVFALNSLYPRATGWLGIRKPSVR